MRWILILLVIVAGCADTEPLRTSMDGLDPPIIYVSGKESNWSGDHAVVMAGGKMVTIHGDVGGGLFRCYAPGDTIIFAEVK